MYPVLKTPRFFLYDIIISSIKDLDTAVGGRLPPADIKCHVCGWLAEAQEIPSNDSSATSGDLLSAFIRQVSGLFYIPLNDRCQAEDSIGVVTMTTIPVEPSHLQHNPTAMAMKALNPAGYRHFTQLYDIVVKRPPIRQ